MGKIISIGSLRGGTGKSTIINNLAVTLAKNYKVIIIDFDTEGQTLRYLFSDLIKNDYNLNNYLISGKPGSGLIKIYDIIYEIKINGLDFSIIPSTNNFSLAHSTFVGGKEHLIEVKSKFEEILIFLKEKFDFILIDTAPGFDNSMLMALEFSDIFFYILRDRKIEYSSFLDYRVKILEKISNKK
jgi:cellulose biosynthesis protein BcsQ